MTPEQETPNVRRSRLFYSALVATIFIGGMMFMAGSMLGRFRHDGVIAWEKYFPLVFFLAGFAGILFLRAICIWQPLPSTDGVRTKLFKYEDQTLVLCLIAAFVGPFLIQPIIDYVVMPVSGFQYCETLSTRGPTFGFPTYAYVPDLALCVSPDSAID